MVLPRFFKKTKRPFSLSGINGWLNDEVVELLYLKSSSLKGHGAIVEIGSWEGRSTTCLAHGLLSNASYQDKKDLRRVFAIDPHLGSKEHAPCNTFAAFQKNMAKQNLDQIVEPLVMTSEEASKNFSTPVELLWIDGSHEYKDVKKDFDLWFPKLVPGGWILFHDSKWPGVRQVLWEDLFTSSFVGPIRRIEDTTFAQKLTKPNDSYKAYNQVLLRIQMTKQALKRTKRRLRRKFKRHWLTNH